MSFEEFCLKRYKVVTEQFESSIEYAFKKTYMDVTPKPQMTEVEAVIMGLAQNINGLNYSIIKLIETDNHYALDSALRSLFENYVSLRFILEDQTVFRAKRYLYSKKNSEYEIGEKLLQTNRRGRELRKFIGMSEEQVNEKLISKLKVYDIDHIRQMMLGELEFKRLSEKWYNVLSNKKLKTFYALCEYMKFQDEYELIYNILSKEAHAMDAFKSFEIEDSLLSFHKLKKPHIMHTNFGTRMNIEVLKDLMKYFKCKEKEREVLAFLNLKKLL
ncbi:DUF5677 domain-containing protein [Chryseomicrobium aureum]|uniref:DUF5677 domain-containing protein n=1 Tax=Chryseomicrobium aureum TaxID=1441723 RepID=UPI00370D94C3